MMPSADKVSKIIEFLSTGNSDELFSRDIVKDNLRLPDSSARKYLDYMTEIGILERFKILRNFGSNSNYMMYAYRLRDKDVY